MTDPDPPQPASTEPAAPRPAGQNLVAAFRAARIRSRPALQAELRAERIALRQQRLNRLGRVMPAPQAADPVPSAADDQAPAPAAESSIFAQIVDGAQAESASRSPPEPAEATSSLPLSAIGFGPGMVIRFRQLGIETASDLAASDPAALRTALGDITRLVNVDVWIATAQKACAA